jgi:hypothetical protein
MVPGHDSATGHRQLRCSRPLRAIVSVHPHDTTLLSGGNGAQPSAPAAHTTRGARLPTAATPPHHNECCHMLLWRRSRKSILHSTPDSRGGGTLLGTQPAVPHHTMPPRGQAPTHAPPHTHSCPAANQGPQRRSAAHHTSPAGNTTPHWSRKVLHGGHISGHPAPNTNPAGAQHAISTTLRAPHMHRHPAPRAVMQLCSTTCNAQARPHPHGQRACSRSAIEQSNQSTSLLPIDQRTTSSQHNEGLAARFWRRLGHAPPRLAHTPRQHRHSPHQGATRNWPRRAPHMRCCRFRNTRVAGWHRARTGAGRQAGRASEAA